MNTYYVVYYNNSKAMFENMMDAIQFAFVKEYYDKARVKVVKVEERNRQTFEVRIKF